eukprot:scaffold9370_cov152-Skeletonema_marinoi.AAC.18
MGGNKPNGGQLRRILPIRWRAIDSSLLPAVSLYNTRLSLKSTWDFTSIDVAPVRTQTVYVGIQYLRLPFSGVRTEKGLLRQESDVNTTPLRHIIPLGDPCSHIDAITVPPLMIILRTDSVERLRTDLSRGVSSA